MNQPPTSDTDIATFGNIGQNPHPSGDTDTTTETGSHTHYPSEASTKMAAVAIEELKPKGILRHGPNDVEDPIGIPKHSVHFPHRIITAVYTRPRTSVVDARVLYYSSLEIRGFRRENGTHALAAAALAAAALAAINLVASTLAASALAALVLVVVGALSAAFAACARSRRRRRRRSRSLRSGGKEPPGMKLAVGDVPRDYMYSEVRPLRHPESRAQYAAITPPLAPAA